MYIDSQEELESFIERAQKSSLLAIDTEFLRERTYYPKLCLMQVATDDEVVVIDPFAVDDLKVMSGILTNPSIMKIFHAGYQDIEIILYDIDCVPTPIFDTQVAAALLGYTQQVGYGALVHSICGVKLKKTDSFTDWSVRPLSESQIEYAKDDVVYLPEIYHTMVKELKEKGRLDWLQGDFKAMEQESYYREDERERFRRLKHVTQLNRRQMAAAREVAAWREHSARSRNTPRKWVLTDEQIVEACKREPKTIDELFMVRGVRERINTKEARQLVALIDSALNSAPDTWPEVTIPSKSEPNVDVPVDMLMAIVRTRAREAGIALPTLASHSDLIAIARGHTKDVDLLKGWRREIVGEELLDFLEGKLALYMEDGSPVIKKRSIS